LFGLKVDKPRKKGGERGVKQREERERERVNK
jgi:hypothetical protein